MPGRPNGAVGSFLRLITINDSYTLDHYPHVASAVIEAKAQVCTHPSSLFSIAVPGPRTNRGAAHRTTTDNHPRTTPHDPSDDLSTQPLHGPPTRRPSSAWWSRAT